MIIKACLYSNSVKLYIYIHIEQIQQILVEELVDTSHANFGIRV